MANKLTTEGFIIKAKVVHGNKYDYSLTVYAKSATPVEITCPEHGLFTQRPNDHLSGNGCRKCAIENKYKNDLNSRKLKFLEKSREVHGNKYAYNLQNYSNNTSIIEITCPEHGLFTQTPDSHTQGRGCHECGMKKFKDTRVFNCGESIVERFTAVHGKLYDYSAVSYQGYYDPVKIICSKHGSFEQSPDRHLAGQGCRKCADEGRAAAKTSAALITLESRFREIHKDRYMYDISDLTKLDGPVRISCQIHGEFEQYVFNHLGGSGCPKCASYSVSKPETEVFNFISKHTKTQQSNRSILNGKEVDIYCDNEKVGIEFNGVYWHSSNSEDLDPLFENKHLEKTTGCAESGVRLYHIFETEWYDKRLIWESVLVNAIEKTPDRLYARKCKVVEVDASRASEFLSDNHLQGRCGSIVRLGLEYEGELVSLMTFGKPRYNKTHDWELIRFCNLIFTNVVGGASRLLSHFKRNYEGSIVSYANRRWSDGGVYEALGFKFIGVSPPSYYYVKTGEKLYHRSAFMKHKLSDKLEHFNPSMTEVQNMYSNGYRRIWDSGQLIFSLCQEVTKC